MKYSRGRVHGLVFAILITTWLAVACEGGRTDAPVETRNDNSTVVQGVDIAIVTVIAAEFEAMLRHMDRTYPIAAPGGRANTFAWTGGEIDRPGPHGPLRLVIALAGEAGTTSGSLAVQQTVNTWQPGVLVLAGIAGGLPPAVNRGDVLVSEAVWGYEYGAMSAELQPRLDWMFQSEPALVEAAINHRRNWQGDITAEKPDPDVSPRHRRGVTASGNKVIETLDSDCVTSVLRMYPGVASIEMEGAGAFAAAELLRDNPDAPATIMLRGISDIPNPRSGVFGDKKDRERWKRYASDSVAAFTVSFLRNALPATTIRPMPETDALLITYTDSAYEAVRKELNAAVTDGATKTAEAIVPAAAHERPLKIVIQKFDDRSQTGELRDSVERWKPRTVLLVDTAMGTGETSVGDVITARIVWPFQMVETTVSPQLGKARRSSRSLVAASQAIEGAWTAGDFGRYGLKSGTIAAGAGIPAWDDMTAIRAISALNPRTAMIDDESMLVVSALLHNKRLRTAPHFLSIQAAHQVAGSPETDEELAGRNAAHAAAELLRLRWPFAPVTPSVGTVSSGP